MTANGCALEIARMHPRPNIQLPPSNATLSLEMTPTVLDRFGTASPLSGVSSAQVMAWRFTLEDAFHNGFGAAFSLAGPLEKSQLTIQLTEASLEFEATDVKNGKTIAGEAHVRYKANLLGPGGRVLVRAVGIATSKRPFTSLDQVNGVVKNAIEMMYERIARAFFAHAPPPSEPAPGAEPAAATDPAPN
jgi:hypothetical protein